MFEQAEEDKEIVCLMFYSLEWWIVAEEHLRAYRYILRFAGEEINSLDKSSSSINRSSNTSEKEVIDASQEALDLHNSIVKSSKRIKVLQTTEIFSRQSLVVIASLFEGAARELFQCIFCRHPSRMYEFLILSLKNTVIKGKVELRDIVEAPNMKRLIYSLASKASTQATNTSFDKIIKNLDKVTSGKLDTEIFSELGMFIEKRHKIVHEDYEASIEAKEVFSAFDAYFQVLQLLEEIALENDIVVINQ